ncbi:uncharacterized protein PFL1_00423 [Pseudozyma flocculosa PF-1]|uniref:Related to Membrane steroid binding protein n=1 Tax=Pseudozyma flocculosa TaxID=84751 RepID=A0A5C3ETH2_9BASI|nr:uncharacterized protein PFL1_00423 [Pseudozyma flocculosa PF-1]EPQ32226.1 hypothetical protein PFL1_00423 [Pseudozyma flocculosa PF-1]SPO34826.1 related to Membrane steroid binding protein [Pseudozyma flocculosa]
MSGLFSGIFGSESHVPSTWERLTTTAEPLFTNPLNLVLLSILIYIALPLLLPSSPTSAKWTPTIAQARSHATAPSDRYSYLPPRHPDTVEWKRYTPRTLALYDGTDSSASPRILLAINGKVFDVTSGKNFYGPGGPYGNFAGRDASRGMAKQSFDLEMITPLDRPIDKLEDLAPSEIKNMKEWEAMFTGKYGIVGELVNEEDL